MIWTETDINKLKDNIDIGSSNLSILLNRDRRSILKKIKKIGYIEKYKESNLFLGRYKDDTKEEERRKKISNTCRENKKSGGLRKGSGRGKKGTYGGYWCDSSYELAWVIYNIEHGIDFKRNHQKFEYYYDDCRKFFIPDFIIDNTYYEIKGYEDIKLKSKIEYFPFKIKVLYKSDLKLIFDYVISIYGKNYISLYEDKRYKCCSSCKGYICKENKFGVCLICRRNKKAHRVIKSIKNICICGNQKCIKSEKCIICKRIKDRKIKNRPSLNILLDEVKEIGYCSTGRKYGVSDNCIRKWIKNALVSNLPSKQDFNGNG